MMPSKGEKELSGKKTATLMGAGASTGAVVGGPPGAFVGGIVGGLVGLAVEDD